MKTAVPAPNDGWRTRNGGWPIYNGERRPMMLQKLRNRARQAVQERIEINLDGFELDLSPEEVIADLNYGVGPIADTFRLAQEGRPEVGRVA